ncbi:hypothetical protein [Sphingomonas soli]|uniref:hypothetical protein n=1 Tax=Sphingomonas soli TaxID=266127 RepID=UPI0008339EE9|nr:hypothetical protein [Sphingomonas soli]
MPAPIVIDPQSVWVLLVASIPALIIGAVVATPINIIGTVAMRALGAAFAPARTRTAWALGAAFAPARTRTAWALAGAMLGGAAMQILDASGPIGFALVATSVFCGWRCSAGD